MSDDPLANLEFGHVAPNLDDSARDISAQDEGILKLQIGYILHLYLVSMEASISGLPAHFVVGRVNSSICHLDYKLVCRWVGRWPGTDFQRMSFSATIHAASFLRPDILNRESKGKRMMRVKCFEA